MFRGPRTPHRVPFDGSFRIDAAPTVPPADTPKKAKLKELLDEETRALHDLQRVLVASDQVSVLLIFQAMDAAGKDGTIRKVLTGVNPAGCQVWSFKEPSEEELDHDFLWRCVRRLPERGRIGIFNRSWYEEVLIVRVHPEHLDHQRLPWRPASDALWVERLESIHDVERHLARNGTVVLKFFLHVSREEQRRRFLARIDEPEKHWKFSEADVRERAFWDDYMRAYEAALNATSRPWAPWYAVPADDKHYMRLAVARTVRAALEALELRYPALEGVERTRLAHMRTLLEGESS